MSQEKVNKYKADKANRKQILQREKRNRILSRIIGAVICIALIGWLGYSAIDSITTKAAASQTEVDLSAVTDYFNHLNETDAESDAETDANTANE